MNSGKKNIFLMILIIMVCWKMVAQEIPNEIRSIIMNVPEDVLIGVGIAKTESDGESILLAENRARNDLARQINSLVQNILRDYTSDSDEELNFQEDISIYQITARLLRSTVISRIKARDGTWWCVLNIRKNYLIDSLNDMNNISPRNLSNNEIRQYSKDISNINNISTLDVVPDWALNPQRHQPEDMIWGLGAARLTNDEDSISLAIERARRSLSYSIESDVSSVNRYIRIIGNETNEYEENHISISSKYNSILYDTIIVDIAKTNDGTWWILLGCFIY